MGFLTQLLMAVWLALLLLLSFGYAHAAWRRMRSRALHQFACRGRDKRRTVGSAWMRNEPRGPPHLMARGKWVQDGHNPRQTW